MSQGQGKADRLAESIEAYYQEMIVSCNGDEYAAMERTVQTLENVSRALISQLEFFKNARK